MISLAAVLNQLPSIDTVATELVQTVDSLKSLLPRSNDREFRVNGGKFTCPEDPKGLYVISPRWNARSGDTTLIKRKLHKHGYATLDYVLGRDLLSPNHLETVDNFKRVRDQYRLDIDRCEREYGFDSYSMIGMSLGVVPAVMEASEDSRVEKMIWISVGDDLAHCLWEGIHTQDLRRAYQQQGIPKEQLSKDWHDLSPINRINGLKGKDIFIHYSEADEIIPAERGHIMVEAMREHGLEPHVQLNKHLGHTGTVTEFLLRPDLHLYDKPLTTS